MKQRINLEILLESIICFLLSALLFYALISDKVANYVHPRINGYLWFAAIALLIISSMFLPAAFTPKHNAKPGKYFLYLVPILFVILIPAGTVQNKAISFSSTATTKATTNSAGTTPQNNGTIISGSTSSDNIGKAATSSALFLPKEDSDGIITIQDEQFANWYQDINQNMNQYDGKTLKFKGQVLVSFHRIDSCSD